MNKMIVHFNTRRHSPYEAFSMLTMEFDSYLIGLSDLYRTYMCNKDAHISKDKEVFYAYAIRVPGATRGHILTDKDNIITEVALYEDTADCYSSELMLNLTEISKKYIGAKIVEVHPDE